MPSLLSCCAMACFAQSAAGAKDALFLLHTRAHKVEPQTVMEANVEQQGQSAGAPPYDVFDMRDHPKNRDQEGDCKWRCDNNTRCTRYVYNAITLYCKMFEESYSTPFDVFDMRDHPKNRNNEGDCKWRCDNDYRCVRHEYVPTTLFCKLFKESGEEISNQSAQAFDVFDERDHPKNRDHEGDCKWRCDNNYRCVRYEYEKSTLYCKLFEKAEDDSNEGAPPFDVFDMRDHPQNREHAHGEGDCKWRCDNNDRCARYEYNALTFFCKMFEKPKDHLDQDDKDTSGEHDKIDQVLVVSEDDKDDKKSEKGFKHDSDQDDKENSEKKAKDDKGNRKSKQRLKRKSDQNDKDESDDKKSKKGFKHNSDQDDRETSDNNAQDYKGNKQLKQKRNSDQDDKKTKHEHEAKGNPNLVSDKHDKHPKKEKNESKKTKEEPESKVYSLIKWFR